MQVALLCSSLCPGTVIVHGLDIAIALKDAPITIVSGFQSPLEKESLKFLLKGSSGGVRLVICPARSAVGMRIPVAWKKPMGDGRLTIRSFIDEHRGIGLLPDVRAASSPRRAMPRRPTTDLAEQRNRFACAISAAVLILHASPNGKLERLATELLASGKQVWTLDDPANASLVNLGAQPLSASNLAPLYAAPVP